ncbi:inositol 2-dehydrogenase [Lactiplantibacillus plantarum]|uniref:inositol 2-dehydrogenase n=1 Tax=Lactiplantibacillus plantarum TaxID=1590 RepID=UPI00240D980E|nr:inositol 2-dehydrogenase [Lactiplantibacillus plantarum]MDG2545341.1 inositol 2-dehydrogenase [Lactiplantibacillus plantarum]
MTKLKIAVIGLGRIGEMHLKNLLKLPELFQVTGIADPARDDLKHLADQYRIPHYSRDYHDLLAQEDVESVLIASATDTHAQIIHDAAEADKDILCEKPIDTDVNRIKELLSFVKGAGVKLQVGFNRRFDHNFLQIKKYVTDGKLGTPQIVKISSRDPELPSLDYVKHSGGLFFDMMIHDLDLIRYLSGSEVKEVTAKGAVLVNPKIGELGDIDTAIVTLKFANGALGVIDNSRQAVYGYDQRAEVFGNKGMAKADNDRNSTVELDCKDSTSLDKMPYFFIDRYQGAYLNELVAFHDTVTENKPLIANGEDGLRAVQLAAACQQSLESGQTVQLNY